MKETTLHIKRTSLSNVSLEKHWPPLETKYLFYLDLEQDEYFEHIPRTQVPCMIETAQKKGQEAARAHGRRHSLKQLLNLLLKEGVRVRFLDKHPASPFTRAQYCKKPKTIEVYRHSLEQMRLFFAEMGEPVSDEEVILLHLHHEWFHHLEETKCGRTDLALPKVVVKQHGPFKWKRPIQRTREIAAHAFTQHVMQLPWSPLLLDYLLDYRRRGWTKGQIREHFQRIMEKVEAAWSSVSAEEHEQLRTP